ncbi:MAG: DUF599 family protein [Alphaproteobacteria bacterium]|nr:DUF599 family protein [Alphaproteobacteria bacterium]
MIVYEIEIFGVEAGLGDLIAPAWFFVFWLVYTLLADGDRGVYNLTAAMRDYRRLWMRRMLDRDVRMVDTQILGNLMRSMSFFASTTMFIIAGLVAVLGAREQAMEVLRGLPFTVDSSALLWNLKVLLLITIFVYAFFKFTWAFRHYSYCLILIGAIPAFDRLDEESHEIAERAAQIATSTGRHFNRGIRAYYFGLAALGWFLHPAIFVLLTVWVTLVIYRREHRSRLLETLGRPNIEGL